MRRKRAIASDGKGRGGLANRSVPLMPTTNVLSAVGVPQGVQFFGEWGGGLAFDSLSGFPERDA